jgi:hypothetical protein
VKSDSWSDREAPPRLHATRNLLAGLFQPRSRAPMYLPIKKPRKTDRKRSVRYRAKVKAKNRVRRGRINAN